MKPRVGVVGAGAAGGAMALAMQASGYPLSGVFSRSESSARKLAGLLGDPDLCRSAEQILAESDWLMISTPDGTIREVCNRFAESSGFHSGQMVFHLSGAMAAEELSTAAEQGAEILALHPVQTLADPIGGAETLKGSWFCLQGSPGGVASGQALVAELGGQAFTLSREQKPLYHAALCMASNYLTVIQALAIDMLAATGIDRKQGLAAIMPLLRGGLDNLENIGIPGALTGPISRGDRATLERHLEAITGSEARQVEMVYRQLGLHGLKLALEKGGASKSQVASLRQLLEES